MTFLENFSGIFAISQRKIKHLLNTLQEKNTDEKAFDEILQDAKFNFRKLSQKYRTQSRTNMQSH